MAKKTLRINLNSLINQATDDRRVRTAYREAMRGASVRQEFGRRLIDSMIDRTNEGLDKKGSPFKPYKDSYKNSLAFQIYKSSGDPVNLQLTGQMLDSMEARPKGAFDVELYFIGAFNNEKAEWNIDGTKNSPKRDFFGISVDEQVNILKNTLKDIQDQGFDFELPQTGEDAFVDVTEEPEEG